jgi:hypothetical protein
MMLSIKKTVFSMLMVGFLLIGSAVAQQQQMMQQPQEQKDYSDDEVELFANTVIKVNPIQQEVQKKMVKIIDEEGMELNQFNAISQQMQQGVEPEGVSDQQMELFERISVKLQEVQVENQKKMHKVIKEQGMTPAKYQEMIRAYHSNPEIKQKVEDMLAEQQE